jgi:TetR/AcrR family transcriptional regulator
VTSDVTAPARTAPTADDSAQSRGDATRRAILDAAIRIFARAGFDAASTRAIATEAGVHHALLRYHFADKDALWRAAVTQMFARQRQEFAAMQSAAPADPRTTEGLKEMVRRFVRYSCAHPEHAQILVHEAITDGERQTWMTDTFVRANNASLFRPLTKQTEGGHLRLDDPVVSATIIGATSQMAFVLSRQLEALYGRSIASGDFAELLADGLVKALFRD